MILKEEPMEGKDFKIAPVGNHLARLYRIIDLGTQKTVWEGVEKMQRKLMFNFELHGEDNEGNPLTTDDGKPLMVTKRYTRSFFETSALRQDLQAWRGKEFTADELQGFDITVLLGKFCMLNVIHNKASNGKTYANVKGLSPVPAAIKKLGEPKGVNEPFIFDLNAFDQAKFDTLPQWLQDTIKESAEYRGTVAAGNPDKVLSDIDDDVPF